MSSRLRGHGGEQVSARDSRGMPSVNIWTVEMVEARLAEAAEVIRCLPPVRVPGYFKEFADRVGRQAVLRIHRTWCGAWIDAASRSWLQLHRTRSNAQRRTVS
jgi:hypothetical protein